MRLFRSWIDNETSVRPASPGRRYFLAAGCACCAVYGLNLPAQAAQSDAVQRHLAAARKAAGDDLQAYLRLAQVVEPPSSGKPPPSIEELMAMPAPPPGKAFDNLYFVGSKWVSAWALTTSDGIILIDAMDNDDEAEHIIDAGMRQLGLDPAQIKMVVVTHGHGDHYGGAGYLSRKYGPRFVASEPDWRLMASTLEFDRPQWGRPPKRDKVVKDGSQLKLGDTTVDVILTPGHTLGTLSLMFDVKDGGQTHRALLWGGTGFNFGKFPNRMARIQAYVDATRRVRDMAGEQKVEVFLSNHSSFDQAVDRLEKMKSGGPNPFVIGTDATQRALTVMNECAQATQVAWKAEG